MEFVVAEMYGYSVEIARMLLGFVMTAEIHWALQSYDLVQ
jgi:hypothetical protein